MRRRTFWACVLPMLFGVPACVSPRGSKAPPPSKTARVTISIIATNDVHGQLLRLPILAGFIDNARAVRAKDGGVLLVDGGDAFQGTIESNLNEGAAVLTAYNHLGYAAMTIGNHEFDFGPVGPASVPVSPSDDAQGALKQRLAEARFPIVSANLVDANDALPNWKNLTRTTETTIDGVRIGIIGLLTETAPDVIKRTVFAGLHVEPLAFASAREAIQLRHHGVNLVVVVAHAGGSCTRFDDPKDLSSCEADSEIFRLARALPPGLVDVIVGGHRNAAVAQIVAGIPIVHAASNLVAFSRVDVVFDGAHRILDERVFAPQRLCAGDPETNCNPGTYEGAAVTPDPTTASVIAPALAAAASLREQPLGVNVVAPFPEKKDGETALSNLFVDLMREAAPGSDVAFANAGSVRDALPAGPLTFGRLHHVMPFDNQLARLELTGAELRAVFAASLSDGEHGLLSISGLKVDASCAGNELSVTVEHPDGAAVRDDERLTVVTNDFLALGGDGLLAKARVTLAHVALDPNTTVLKALIDGLERRKSIAPDDLALDDPKHPRVRIAGTWPLRCNEGSAPTTH